METITSPLGNERFAHERLNYDCLARWRDFERTPRGVRLHAETETGAAAEVTLEFVLPGVVRLRARAEGFRSEERDAAGGCPLVQEDWESVPFMLSEGADHLHLASASVQLDVARDPWRISLLDAAGDIVCREASERVPDRSAGGDGAPAVADLGFLRGRGGERVMVRETFELVPGEDLYGLGEQFDRINRVGQRFELWATDAYGTSRRASYKNVPFLWSTRGYGLFVNTSFRVAFDLGTVSLLTHSFTHEGPQLDMFLLYGPGPTAILGRYCELTCYAPPPPRWSFGLWMSPHDCQDGAEVERVAEELSDRDIPCDVLHLDSRWMGQSSNWCDLQWDGARFPDPEGMIQELRERGLRLCLWECPYVAESASVFEQGRERGYFVKDERGEPYMMIVWAEIVPPVAIVDFTNPDAVDWWQSLHRPLLEQGVSVFRTDLGERAPEDGIYHSGMTGREAHNLYPMLYNDAVFDVTRAVRGQGLVWARSGWACSQRTPTCSAGQPLADFPHMANQLRAMLSIGMSGIPFYGHDIGGFAGPSDPELYVRWAQWGMFSSHVRCHGSTTREPWAFGERAEAIFRRYAKLRYRLLPYIYSTAVHATQTGQPVARALVLKYNRDPNVRHLDSEYLFGDSFLVAPVLERGARRRMVYLPAGQWVDYWSREVYQGPTWLNYPAPLEILPLFVRRGAIVPMGPEVARADQAVGQGLVLDVYPADEGRFTLHDVGAPPVGISYSADSTLLQMVVGPLAVPPVIVLNDFPSVRHVTVNNRPHDGGRVEGGGVVIELPEPGKAEIMVWR